MVSRIANEEKGATAVIVALVLVILVGFAALVVDYATLFQQRRQLQNAVDAAAMAGAQQIATDVTKTREQAYVYAEKNGVSRSEVTENRIIRVFNPGDGVRVTAQRRVNLIFAPVLGIASELVGATATAIVTQIQPGDIWPWGVTGESIALAGGGEVTLKVGARNNLVGNFMALDFPSSSGGNSYNEYIKHGYCSTYDPNPCPIPNIPPGTWPVDTETGNMIGPTIDGVDYLFSQPLADPDNLNDIRNPRVGLVPILAEGTWDEVQGKSTVEVVGFAVFYLEDISENASLGQVEITGSFLSYAYGVGSSKCLDCPLQGLIGARLWE